jgi:hypothetical protein
MIRKAFVSLICLMTIPLVAHAQYQPPDLSQWHQTKGDHFVVYVQNRDDESTARDVLRAAEEDYDKVTRQIGYARYGNFWTWEERVKIIIFPTQLSFSMTTDQPIWSKGYAVRDSRLFASRAIVTFKQEEGFIENVLPHEIGHLILRDFIGFERPIPLWFDEGVAQLQEPPDEEERAGMVLIAKNAETVPFELLESLDIRHEKDSRKVAIFYAQSRMVLEFLIRNYGQAAFERLCREMKNGLAFDDAFKAAYAPSVESFKALESRWLADFGVQASGSN